MVYTRRKPSSKRARPGLTPKPFKCKHWWLFEEPDGPSVIGTCLKCGATQEIVSFWEARERIPTDAELKDRLDPDYDPAGIANTFIV